MSATRNEDGSVTVTTVIEAHKVQALEFAHVSFEDLIDEIENPAVEEAEKLEIAAAEKLYQSEFDGGAVDGSIFLNKIALRDWYRAHDAYRNAAERKAEAEAAKAAADQRVADAKAAIGL